MLKLKMPPEKLGFSTEEWDKFLDLTEKNPSRAADELQSRIDRHKTRNELVGKPVGPEHETAGRVATLPANPLDLPEYQEAVVAAQSARANLPSAPGVKAAAGVEGRDPTLSGYKSTEQYLHAGEATERAIIEGRPAGSEPEAHPFDRTASTGTAGEVRGSHAEKQAAVLAPDKPVGVSKEMCADCQSWFRQRAVERGIPQFVDDPTGTRAFMPDGSVHMVPHPADQSSFFNQGAQNGGR